MFHANSNLVVASTNKGRIYGFDYRNPKGILF